MALHPVSLHPRDGSIAADELRHLLDALVERSEVPVEFPAEVLAAAEAAAAGPGAPDRTDHSERADRSGRVDRTDVEFVTLDPASSTDLDQAMHLSREGDGYRVLYAIADVPSFVELDGPIDAETRRRGETVYLPDRRISLHPEMLSEGVASILPEQDTPAFVWTFALDATGAVTGTTLERALVRSRAKLAYDAVQADLDAGTGLEMMQLLLEIGAKRRELEAQRRGASLNLPEQEVFADGEALRLQWRTPLPIEDANAQISLMTGMEAARIMIEGGAGILRTMPAADEGSIRDLRRKAKALGQPWPEDMVYGDFLRTLHWSEPRHLALLNQAAKLFRGASYLAFTSPDELPADPAEQVQAAIGAPYAHTTAPLRRLVDRFVLLTCHHLLGGDDLPDALRTALPLIPQVMQETGSRAGAIERQAIDIVEALALRSSIGSELEATVLTSSDGTAQLQLSEPPVTVRAAVPGKPGDVVRVRVESVDPAAGKVQIVPAAGRPAADEGRTETAEVDEVQASAPGQRAAS